LWAIVWVLAQAIGFFPTKRLLEKKDKVPGAFVEGKMRGLIQYHGIGLAQDCPLALRKDTPVTL